MTIPEPVDLSVIDAKDLEKIEEKKKKMDRVMEVIHENGLDNNEEFMKEIKNLMKEL